MRSTLLTNSVYNTVLLAIDTFHFSFDFHLKNNVCIKNNSNSIEVHKVKSKDLPFLYLLVSLLRAFTLAESSNRFFPCP